MWATIARSSNNQDAVNRAANIMQTLTLVMSADQIQKAQEMAAKWKPIPNDNDNDNDKLS